MRISKLSFYEILFSLTIVFFVCIGTSFLDAISATDLRWLFDIFLFFYLFLNKKFLLAIHPLFSLLLIIYLSWYCFINAVYAIYFSGILYPRITDYAINF